MEPENRGIADGVCRMLLIRELLNQGVCAPWQILQYQRETPTGKAEKRT